MCVCVCVLNGSVVSVVCGVEVKGRALTAYLVNAPTAGSRALMMRCSALTSLCPPERSLHSSSDAGSNHVGSLLLSSSLSAQGLTALIVPINRGFQS